MVATPLRDPWQVPRVGPLVPLPWSAAPAPAGPRERSAPAPPTPPPAQPDDRPDRAIGRREVALGQRTADRLRRALGPGETIDAGPARVAVRGPGWWMEFLFFSDGPTVAYTGALDVNAVALLVVAASEASHD